MKKYVNGNLEDMTDSEISELNTLRTVAAADQKEIDDAKTVTETNKKSGKAKLKVLGLSDDEILALFPDSSTGD
jgi:hypothetical protein